MRRTITAIRRLLTAVQAGKHLRYATLNGAIATLLAAGELVQASAHLVRLGLTGEELRSFRSHYGKCVKRAYRAAVGGAAPLVCWVDVDGHYRLVCVYLPHDRALTAGVTAYKRLNALVSGRTAASYARCA